MKGKTEMKVTKILTYAGVAIIGLCALGLTAKAALGVGLALVCLIFWASVLAGMLAVVQFAARQLKK